MKQNCIILFLIFSSSLFAYGTYLPKELNTYVIEKFPREAIRNIAPSPSNPKLMQVEMENGSTFLYNKKKQVMSVSLAEESEIPISEVSEEIQNYVLSHFPNAKIRAWECGKKTETITLTTGEVLLFDIKTKELLILP